VTCRVGMLDRTVDVLEMRPCYLLYYLIFRVVVGIAWSGCGDVRGCCQPVFIGCI